MKTLFIFLVLLTNLSLASEIKMMNEARTAFEENKLEKAILTYSKIPKNSDFWLESLEERAWTYLKMGDFEKALADLKSATHPALSAQVGPESLMLSAFISLKTCAYKDALEKVNLFKERMLPKVTALEAIVANPRTAEAKKYLPKLKNEKLTMISLGADAEKLPRYFHRDVSLNESIQNGKYRQAYNRLQALAQLDLNEIEKNLTKMKLIEIEVIHRVSLLKPELTNKDLKFSKVNKNNQISFPIIGEELWLDEVGKYQVKAQGCKGNI
jgi:hypothetical protein